MFLKLRIVFTVLSALCAALVLPLGTWLNLTWAIVAAAAGVAFFLLMLLCKQEQEKREAQELKTDIPESNENSDAI